MSTRMDLWIQALIAMAEPVIWPPACNLWLTDDQKDGPDPADGVPDRDSRPRSDRTTRDTTP